MTFTGEGSDSNQVVETSFYQDSKSSALATSSWVGIQVWGYSIFSLFQDHPEIQIVM